MSSKYYDSSDKSVIDGDIAYAIDLNSINLSADSAFQQVEIDINDVGILSENWAETSRKWAEETEDVEVTPGHYSSLHWAAKAQDAEDGAQTAEANATVEASDAATSALAAATSESNAAISAFSAITSENNASGSASDASSFAADAAYDAGLASDSATLAYKWAEEVEDVEVAPGEYSAHHWAIKAADYAYLPLTGGTLTGDLYCPNIYATSTLNLVPSGQYTGISLEDGRHWITANDGSGNFNIRAGHEWDEVKEDGYIGHITFHQGSGYWGVNISSSSLTTGSSTSLSEVCRFSVSGSVEAKTTAKAWVTFDATGTLNIIDSFNIGSVADLGIGRYQVNYGATFSTYSTAVGSGSRGGNTDNGTCITIMPLWSFALKVGCKDLGGTLSDADTCQIVIFDN